MYKAYSGDYPFVFLFIIIREKYNKRPEDEARPDINQTLLVLQYPLSWESHSKQKSRTQSPSAGSLTFFLVLFGLLTMGCHAHVYISIVPLPRVFSTPYVATIGSGSSSAIDHTIAVVSNLHYVQKSYGKANRQTRSSQLPVTSHHGQTDKCDIYILVTCRP